MKPTHIWATSRLMVIVAFCFAHNALGQVASNKVSVRDTTSAGEGLVLYIEMKPAREITNLGAFSTNASEQAMIQQMLNRETGMDRSTIRLTDSSGAVRFSGHVTGSNRDEICMIVLEQESTPLISRLYTEVPSQNPSTKYSLCPISLQMRPGDAVPVGERVVSDILAYIGKCLAAPGNSEARKQLQWLNASALPPSPQMATNFLRTACITNIIDVENAGVSPSKRTLIASYLSSLRPDEWVTYMDCGPDSNGTHNWRPVRVKYKSDLFGKNLQGVFILMEDDSVALVD